MLKFSVNKRLMLRCMANIFLFLSIFANSCLTISFCLLQVSDWIRASFPVGIGKVEVKSYDRT